MALTPIPYTPPVDTVTTVADTASTQNQIAATDLAGIVANTGTNATVATPTTTTDATGVTVTNTTIDGTPAIITTTPANAVTGTLETTTVTLLTAAPPATPVVTSAPVTTTDTTTPTNTPDTTAGTVTTTAINTPVTTTTDTAAPTDTVLIDPPVTTATPPANTQPAPVITDILAQEGTTQSRVFDGSHIADTAPVLKGTAMPGVELGIFDNGQLLGKTTADDNWAWTFQPQAWKDDPTAATGLHVFTAAHLNADNSPGLTSVYSYTCAINADPRPLLVPVITEVKDDVGASQGNVLDLVAPLDDTTPEFQGTSQPGTLVTLYDNGVKVLETTTGADWLWHAALTSPLASGQHTFSVEATYPDGLGVTPAPYKFDGVIVAEDASAANTVAATPAADTDTPAVVPADVPMDVLDTSSTSLDLLLANAGLVAAAPVTGNTTDTVTTVQALSISLDTLPMHELAF